MTYDVCPVCEQRVPGFPRVEFPDDDAPYHVPCWRALGAGPGTHYLPSAIVPAYRDPDLIDDHGVYPPPEMRTSLFL